jgi:ABC transporter with metal-binding/Fe-S-binding domain ATP-binding protein
MFHTVNQQLTELQAEAMGKEYVVSYTKGRKEEELEDLEETLASLDVDVVVTGAIASQYQKQRVDRISSKLGLSHFSPLWGRDRVELMTDIIDSDMEFIFSAVAAFGLDDSWLGKKADQTALNKLMELNKLYSVDVCGEGGEYETLVLDAPCFRKRLEILEAEKVWDGSSGRYHVSEAVLMRKA